MHHKPTYPSKVWLNGEIVDSADAKISVFDRGFIFGDGIYEVMARINGHFFYKEAHLTRLRWCLDQIQVPADVGIMEEAIPELLEASELKDKDCLLYFQVSRGVAPRQHSFPKGISATMMMYAWPKTLPEINSADASVILRDDYRWSRCDIKSTSLLGNVMANELAIANNSYETLFVRDGIITEASHCNVFFVKNEVIYTHPNGPFILDGITRQVVLELCERLNIEVRQEGISASKVKDMDEAFISGTSTQIMAIKQLEDHIFYENKCGPMTRKLQEAFAELKKLKG